MEIFGELFVETLSGFIGKDILIYELFFLSIPLHGVGFVLKYFFDEKRAEKKINKFREIYENKEIKPLVFNNKAISLTLNVISMLTCFIIGYYFVGETLKVSIIQYGLINGYLVCSVAVNLWDTAFGVKTIYSKKIALEKKNLF